MLLGTAAFTSGNVAAQGQNQTEEGWAIPLLPELMYNELVAAHDSVYTSNYAFMCVKNGE